MVTKAIPGLVGIVLGSLTFGGCFGGNEEDFSQTEFRGLKTGDNRCEILESSYSTNGIPNMSRLGMFERTLRGWEATDVFSGYETVLPVGTSIYNLFQEACNNKDKNTLGFKIKLEGNERFMYLLEEYSRPI